jgi:hypothetical protein
MSRWFLPLSLSIYISSELSIEPARFSLAEAVEILAKEWKTDKNSSWDYLIQSMVREKPIDWL